MRTDLGMVVSGIVVAPFIVLAKSDLLIFELFFLICLRLNGVPEGGSGLCDLFVELQGDALLDEGGVPEIRGGDDGQTDLLLCLRGAVLVRYPGGRTAGPDTRGFRL